MNKLLNYAGNVGNFCEKGLCGLVNGVAPILTLPSSIMSFRNKKLLFVEEKENYTSAEGAGFGLGVFAGLSLAVFTLSSAAQEISNGNYDPAIALGIINGISLGYEGWNYFNKESS